MTDAESGTYRALTGSYLPSRMKPDGDTLRFCPDEPARLVSLLRSELLVLGNDGSVPLRLNGVAAPEHEYEGVTQRLAEVATSALMEQVGLRSSARARGVILANRCDVRGRVVAYAFRELPRSKRSVAPLRVEQSVNAALALAGTAYVTTYSSQPSAHRRVLKRLGAEACARRRGVWAADRSRAGFRLLSDGSLGRRGALILPKLFRRCVQYLAARRGRMTLLEWLRENREMDDLIIEPTSAGKRARLSDVIDCGREGLVRLRCHPNEVAFVDR